MWKSVCASCAEANHTCSYALQLDLSDNMMGPEGAKALAPALSVNASLTEVLAFLVELATLACMLTFSLASR